MVKINEYEFTFGADPEFFVAKKGVPVSAHGLVPGTKAAPMPVKGGAVQVDGMALEFNIDPAKDPERFAFNLDLVLNQIMKMVPNYEVYGGCVANFGVDYIKAQPKEASELGCNPDYNAYTGLANPRPDVDTPFRTAAGHIHIGWTNNVDPMDPGHFKACQRVVKQLDRYVGVPSLFWDMDVKRRELYGKAGAFRPTHFGVEYRVLSNAWLLKPDHNYFLRKYVIHQSIEAIKALFDDPEDCDNDMFGKTASEIINNSDLESAKAAIAYSGKIISPKKFREEIVGVK